MIDNERSRVHTKEENCFQRMNDDDDKIEIDREQAAREEIIIKKKINKFITEWE